MTKQPAQKSAPPAPTAQDEFVNSDATPKFKALSDDDLETLIDHALAVYSRGEEITYADGQERIWRLFFNKSSNDARLTVVLSWGSNELGQHDFAWSAMAVDGAADTVRAALKSLAG